MPSQCRPLVLDRFVRPLTIKSLRGKRQENCPAFWREGGIFPLSARAGVGTQRLPRLPQTTALQLRRGYLGFAVRALAVFVSCLRRSSDIVSSHMIHSYPW